MKTLDSAQQRTSDTWRPERLQHAAILYVAICFTEVNEYGRGGGRPMFLSRQNG